jgi:DNA polymerase-1
MRVLILDGHNLIHRARAGFHRGDHSVTFMFFRSLRPLVEKMNPDKVYFVLEGIPKKRIATDANYKANRKIDNSDPKWQEMQDFFRQKDECVELLYRAFPFSIVRHPDFEADDIIAHYARLHKEDDVIIASGDSDFIQLLTDENPQIKLYHPIKKDFVIPPDYNYLEWKSIRGDATDNVPGIPRHGDKTAEKIMRNPDLFAQKMEDPEWKAHFELNLSLIRIDPLTDDEIAGIHVVEPGLQTSLIQEQFQVWQFSFASKEKPWNTFVQTFSAVM